MRPPDNTRRDYVVLALSLALAAVFIYAGVDKIQDRLQFADTIAAFRILPAALINLLALGLPPFEIACGVLLLAPLTRRIGALAVTLVCMLYYVGAIVRAPSRPHARLRLLRDGHAVATQNVAGVRTGPRPVRVRPVRLFACNCAAVGTCREQVGDQGITTCVPTAHRTTALPFVNRTERLGCRSADKRLCTPVQRELSAAADAA